MTIYNINMGIGWASSGVEYAQAYRSNIFKKNKQDAKFIFTEFFRENIQPMTQNIGFEDHEVIVMLQSFTDVKVSPTTYSLEDLEQSFSMKASEVTKSADRVVYVLNDGAIYLTAYLDKTHQDKVYKTEWVVRGKLIQRDYYSYVKTYSEYFKPVDNKARLYQRRFFNQDGSVAYEELLNGDESLYLFKDRTIYSKRALLEYFIESLNLTSEDMIIIDRSTGQGAEILKAKGPAKVGIIIHAEHYNEGLTTRDKILWNNHYDYVFTNASSIDFYICATEKQKEILGQQFLDYKKITSRIEAIPVGSLDRLKKQAKRKSNSLITASRLAGEKHLDWLVRAVIQARESIQDLTLDIYGRGPEEGKLREIIAAHDAGDYIRLMGQQNLDDVYKNYTSYVSASTSEGFGLTLLEAVGSGLGMVGFDVPYGNQTFIREDENGYLVPYVRNEEEENIAGLTRAIIQLQEKEEDAKGLSGVQKVSYALAEPFLTKHIQKKWKNIEEEMCHD